MKKNAKRVLLLACVHSIFRSTRSVDRARESGDTVAIYFLRDTLYVCLHPLVIAVTALQE